MDGKKHSAASGRRLRNRSRKPPTVRPRVETLEERELLACNVLSGFVFEDVNNNGIRDPGEPPIAGSPIELRRSDGTVVGHAVTDSQGQYVFDHDETIDTSPATHAVQVVFEPTKTNRVQSRSLAQFDPAMGTLTAVEFRINGQINSVIQVENLDPTPTTVEATVAGQVTLMGPGLSSLVMMSTETWSFEADAFDGTLDYSGRSGTAFAERTVNGQETAMVTAAEDLSAYVGTGTVTLESAARATSFASGGGNLSATIGSTGGADVTVIYHYIPSNCLRPGDYTIVQTEQPEGFLDGRDGQASALVADSVGSDQIPVTLGSQDASGYNFAELRPAAISGSVYEDADNDGVRDRGEAGIGDVKIFLIGVEDTGRMVERSVTTGPDGSYRFDLLRPGVYELREIQPRGYLDGQETVGNLGGVVGLAGDDQLADISLAPGQQGTDYNFGELRSASISGLVFVDKNLNGRRDKKDKRLAGVVITLTGIDDRGNQVLMTTKTDKRGRYRFEGLRPGTYTVIETQPPKYLDYKALAGSHGGMVETNAIAGIALQSGDDATDYNFAERKRRKAKTRGAIVCPDGGVQFAKRRKKK